MDERGDLDGFKKVIDQLSKDADFCYETGGEDVST